MARTSTARDRLIEAAVDLIYARSYGAVGVQEICERAGVHKGSFYHFFPSKRDLTLAASEELARRLDERILTPAFAADLPPLERIPRFFETITALQCEFRESTGQVLGCPLGNLALEMSTQDELLRAQLDTLFRRIEARITATLEEARREGTLREVDPPAAARALFAYVEGALLMAKTRNDPQLVHELGRAALGLIGAAATNSGP